MCFDAGDQGSHQRGSAHEDAEVCHTDQQGGGLHEAEMLEVLRGATQERRDSRIISIRVHRTALRHPILSTSNAESVEVGEDASRLSCLREPASPRRSSLSQVQQKANEEEMWSSALNMRVAFAHEDTDDTESATVIRGGRAFGKMQGACL